MRHIYLYTLFLLLIGGMGIYIVYAERVHRAEMAQVEHARIILVQIIYPPLTVVITPAAADEKENSEARK